MNMHHNQRGYTLIEVMLAATIAASIMGCILSFVIQGSMMLKTIQKENELQQSLAIGMDKLTRELLTSDQLRFVNNIGFQPDTDDKVLTFTCNKKLVRYYIDEQNELSRNFSGVGLPIASNVKSLKIKYCDSNGFEILPGAPVSQVKLIRIELTGSMTGIREITLSSAVALRTINP